MVYYSGDRTLTGHCDSPVEARHRHTLLLSCTDITQQSDNSSSFTGLDCVNGTMLGRLLLPGGRGHSQELLGRHFFPLLVLYGTKAPIIGPYMRHEELVRMPELDLYGTRDNESLDQ